MLKRAIRFASSLWFWAWITLCALIAVKLSPDRSGNPRYLTSPEWVNVGGVAYDGRTIIETLNSPINCGPPPQNSTDFLKWLRKMMPVVLEHQASDASESWFNIDIPSVPDFYRFKFGDYLSHVLKPTGCEIVERDQKLYICLWDSESVRMTRLYPCPRIAPSELIDTLTVSVSKSSWEIDGGEDTIRIIESDLQSIMVITCPYRTHKEIEGLNESLCQRAGIGKVCQPTLVDAISQFVQQYLYGKSNSNPSVQQNQFQGMGAFQGGMGGGGGMGGMGGRIGGGTSPAQAGMF